MFRSIGKLKAVQFTSAFRQIIDFCYPPACAVCQAVIHAPTGRLCAGCEGKLSEIERAAACAKCAMPIAQIDAPCPRCFGEGILPLRSFSLLMSKVRRFLTHIVPGKLVVAIPARQMTKVDRLSVFPIEDPIVIPTTERMTRGAILITAENVAHGNFTRKKIVLILQAARAA